jgi:hypothetical protein
LGDETILIASRYSRAIDLLSALAADDRARLAGTHGARLGPALREALDAVEAVHASGTEAVRNWPEQGRRVVAQIAVLRAALDASGVGPEARRIARALLEEIERSGA